MCDLAARLFAPGIDACRIGCFRREVRIVGPLPQEPMHLTKPNAEAMGEVLIEFEVLGVMVWRDALFIADSLELIDGPAETVALVGDETLRNSHERLGTVGMYACDLAKQSRNAAKAAFRQEPDHFGFRMNAYNA